MTCVPREDSDRPVWSEPSAFAMCPRYFHVDNEDSDQSVDHTPQQVDVMKVWHDLPLSKL